jgi:hypothetical protein
MRTSWICAPAAALCLLAAGCGSAAAPPGARVTSNRATGPTLAGNRRLARAEAAKLLALVPVPAGARRLRAAPASMPMPVLGEPGVTGLVDAQQSWRLNMPISSAARWLAAHRPAGLKETGWANPPPPTGYSFAGPAGAAWSGAELEVGVAPDGPNASFLRADGLVAWLDPVPYRDTATGPRLRVLASGRCPATDAGVVGVRNPGAHLTGALLPAGRPATALRCSYYGANGKSFKLKAQQRLGPARARALASAIARIPVSHLVGSTTSCPADDGSAVLVAFGYPGSGSVDVWAEVTGCATISNGYIYAGGELPKVSQGRF